MPGRVRRHYRAAATAPSRARVCLLLTAGLLAAIQLLWWHHGGAAEALGMPARRICSRGSRSMACRQLLAKLALEPTALGSACGRQMSKAGSSGSNPGVALHGCQTCGAIGTAKAAICAGCRLKPCGHQHGGRQRCCQLSHIPLLPAAAFCCYLAALLCCQPAPGGQPGHDAIISRRWCSCCSRAACGAVCLLHWQLCCGPAVPGWRRLLAGAQGGEGIVSPGAVVSSGGPLGCARKRTRGGRDGGGGSRYWLPRGRRRKPRCNVVLGSSPVSRPLHAGCKVELRFACT